MWYSGNHFQLHGEVSFGVKLAKSSLFMFVLRTIYRRRKPIKFHYSLQQRAVVNRQESRKNMITRDVSVQDIIRSEKHYLNIAYEDSTADLSDDEGLFMVQVNLNKSRNKRQSLVSAFQRRPLFDILNCLGLQHKT